jgi:hypothetical protein
MRTAKQLLTVCEKARQPLVLSRISTFVKLLCSVCEFGVPIPQAFAISRGE